MAHIQSLYAKLWKPQNIAVDKINSQMMFIDNIDALEAFALSVLKRSDIPVASLDELRAVNTSDTALYVTGTTIVVKSHGLYFFDRGNTTADDGKNIIAPSAGGGRWISNLSFVSDVNINDQTPTYTPSGTFANIVSGEKLSISMGKIMRAINELVAHLDNRSNPHQITFTEATTLSRLISNENEAVSRGKISKAVSDLINHLADTNNPHVVTKSQIGLGSVPNVSTNDQTPTYTQASTFANIISGEKLSVSMGKIMRAIGELISHLNSKTNPHTVTATQIGLGNVPNVATNDQAPTYTSAATLATLTSGEKLSVSMGKIMKAITDLISHLANKSNPHAVTAAQAGAIPVAFSSNNTSTNEDDLIEILSNTLNAMPDNSTRIIRVNFSMQHEHFVSGISATITVHRVSSQYGNAVAVTCSSGYPEMFIKGFANGAWGDWVSVRASTMATASVE